MSNLRRFGLLATSIWQSDRFTSLEHLDARLAYLWLHTSAKTSAGAMRTGPAHLFEEVDFIESLERASDIFEELVEAKLIHWQRPYVIINKYLSHNPVKSYRHAIGAFKEALALPNCEAKSGLISELQKQSGAMDLASWQDKNGQPHPVLFDICAYLHERSDPSDTPPEPFGNPSGKIYKENENEKGERITSPGTEFLQDGTPDRTQSSDSQRRPEGPTEELKRSRLARGEGVH